jgi:malonyl CoA-acyl carrier protein transacylase
MIVGLFPGQGIPARTVLEALPSDDPLLASARDVLGYDLRRKVEIAARRKGAMLPTSLAQPAIFTASLISFRRAEANGRTFDCFVGHSLGEYSALVAAGALGFEHALRCVAVRAEAMQTASRASHGGMAAILGLDLDVVEGLARASGAEVANDNAPAQAVIAGPEDRLAEAAAMARSHGGRSVLLEVSGPFHTAAMAPARPMLSRALEKADIGAPRVPVVANVTARPHGQAHEIAALLVDQLCERVRFRESLEWLWEAGAREHEDLGPGRVVAGLAQRTFARMRSEEVEVHA